MNRATRLGALVLACAACAHRTAPPDPPAYGTPDYEVPATAPGRSAAPPTGPSASPGPGGAASSNAARLASIRSSVEQTLARQAKLLWETWTRGAPPDLDASLARREPLFSAQTAAQTLAFVKGERDRAANEDRRALSLLYAFLLGEHLSGETAPAKAPPQSMLTWNGRAVATTQVPMLLSAEPDPARRAALEHAWAEAGRRRGAAEEARWRGIAAAATRVGYGSLPALATELRGEPAEALAALARGVLGATETTYRALLQALAREEMGAEPSRLRGRDLPRLLRVSEDARAFPAGRAAADVGETMAAIGLDLERRPGVVLDLAARPGKDPRPLALPVEVPGSVRVSFAPQGGAAELRALLHEMGAATFYAHVTTPVLEFRRLGTVTAECWAFLFEDLAGDPSWLSERTKLADSHLTPVVRAAAARRLHAARTLAARILVEIEREREPGRARDAAKAVLESAFARPVEADELQLFLQEREPLLESADALRALLLAAQAQAFLSNRAGSSWWRSKESGQWLATAFAEGSRLDPGELARSFGAPGVDASALAASSRVRAAAAGIRVAQAEAR